MAAKNSHLNSLNPYLHGPYAPVCEEASADELQVKGEIPKDFAGAYYRNGPNPKRHHQGCIIGLTVTEWCMPFFSKMAKQGTEIVISAPWISLPMNKMR